MGSGAAMIRGVARLTVHVGAPPVGFCDVTILPVPSAATHSDTDGHEISAIGVWGSKPVSPLSVSPSTYAALQVWMPPVGSDDARMWPSRSPATHSDTDGQEIAS